MQNSKLLVVLAIFALVLTSLGQKVYHSEFTDTANTATTLYLAQ